MKLEHFSPVIDWWNNREEIIIRDTSEIENLAKGGPIAYADYYIFNNGSLKDYETRLLEILEQI